MSSRSRRDRGRDPPRARRTTPAARGHNRVRTRGRFGKLDLAANGAASEAETAEEAFELASALARRRRARWRACRRRPAARRRLARPLLVAAPTRFGGAPAATARISARVLRRERRVGSATRPTRPALFASGSVAEAARMPRSRSPSSARWPRGSLRTPPFEAAEPALLPPFFSTSARHRPGGDLRVRRRVVARRRVSVRTIGRRARHRAQTLLRGASPRAPQLPAAGKGERARRRRRERGRPRPLERRETRRRGDIGDARRRGGAEMPAALGCALALGVAVARQGAVARRRSDGPSRGSVRVAEQLPRVDAAAATMAVETSGVRIRVVCIASRSASPPRTPTRRATRATLARVSCPCASDSPIDSRTRSRRRS